MAYVVALTGGIGSGKTTVSDMFLKLGVPVIDADVISRQLVEPGKPCYKAIVKHFGQHVLNPDKTLNRRTLRHIVFDEPKQRKWLEKLLHPEINKIIYSEIDKVTYPYCIAVIPLLVENCPAYYEIVDWVLVVEATPIQQIKRLMERDKDPDDVLKKMMHVQHGIQHRKQVADDLIENNGTIKELEKTIQSLHKQYLEKAKEGSKREERRNELKNDPPENIKS